MCTVNPSFLAFGSFALRLTLTLAFGYLGVVSIPFALLPSDLAFMSLIRIVKTLLVLVAELDIVFLDIRSIQFNSTQLASNLLVLFSLKPCPLRP